MVAFCRTISKLLVAKALYPQGLTHIFIAPVSNAKMNARAKTGMEILARPMPADLSARVSLSADMRPKPIIMPMRKARGSDKEKNVGSRVASSTRMSVGETPLLMIRSTSLTARPITMTMVKMMMQSRVGERISLII